MRSSVPAVFALALFLFYGWPCPAVAQDLPLVKSPVTVTVVEKEGVVNRAPNIATCDAGMLDALTTPRLIRTFVLRNSGSAPLAITHLQATCGCETVLLNAKPGNAPTPLAPGAEASVQVTLDAAHLHYGDFRKYVYVYVQESGGPVFALELRGTLKEALSLSPLVAAFGKIPAGSRKAIPLTVRIDRRLLPPLARSPEPHLVSTSPDVVIARTAAPDAPADKSGLVVRSYTLTLARHARIGLLSGDVYFLPGGESPPAMPQPGSTAALAGAMVAVAGEVIGHIQAMPSVVVQGALAQGTETTMQVLLTGDTPQSLTGATVSSLVSWLTARLLPASSASGNRRTLEIRLLKNAPPGNLNGQIAVVTRDGERLVIPFFGSVNPK